jgi:dipeptidyl aminopeptidase/acylaminoacyl peptidase
MFVMYPPGFSDKEKYPLVHLLHGGPNGSWRNEFHLRFNAVLLVARGYVVTLINFRGSTGDESGEEFAQKVWGNWSTFPVEDVRNATQVMIDTGYIDKEKLAIVGGSFGAYLGAKFLGDARSSNGWKFCAAVLHAGVYDPINFFAADAYWVQKTNFGENTLTDFEENTPWPPTTNWDKFEEVSPVLNSNNYYTPTLLTHGSGDLRVPWRQSVLMHRALIQRGTRSRLCLFPLLGHRLDMPSANVQWWIAALDWLEENCCPKDR